MDQPLFKTNNSSRTDRQYFLDNLEFTAPYVVILLTLATIGTFGNILIIGTISAIKKLRTSWNIFIVNLAVANATVTTFVMTLNVVGLIEGEIFFDNKEALCESIPVVYLGNFYISLMTLTIMTYDRASHICYGNKFRKKFSTTTRLVIVINLWVICTLLQIPNLVLGSSYDRRVMTCAFNHKSYFTYSAILVFAVVLIPWTFTAVCYARIYLHIKNGKQRVGQFEDAENRSEYYINRRQIVNSIDFAKTFFIVFVAFSICWAPYFVLITTDYYGVYPAEFHAACLLMSYGSSSVNWIIYGITNKNIRRGYICFLLSIVRHTNARHEHNDTYVVESPEHESRL